MTPEASSLFIRDSQRYTRNENIRVLAKVPIKNLILASQPRVTRLIYRGRELSHKLIWMEMVIWSVGAIVGPWKSERERGTVNSYGSLDGPIYLHPKVPKIEDKIDT